MKKLAAMKQAALMKKKSESAKQLANKKAADLKKL